MKHILCLCLTAPFCAACCIPDVSSNQPALFKAPSSVKTSRRYSSCWRLSSRSCSIFSVQGAKSLSLELFTLKTAAGSPPAPSGNIDQPSCTGRILCRTDPDTHQISSLAVENLAPSSASSHRWSRCPLPPATDKRHLRAHRHHLGAADRAVRALPQPAAKRIPTPTTCPTMRWKIRRKSKATPHSWSPSPFLRSRLPDFCVAQAVKSGKNGSGCGIMHWVSPKLYVR